jgi:hypothetical protein
MSINKVDLLANFKFILFIIASKNYDYFLCGEGNIRRYPLECNHAFCNICNLLSFATSTSHFYNYVFYIFTFGPMYDLKYN